MTIEPWVSAMASTNSKTTITIVPGPSLADQPWWSGLHKTINQSYAVKNFAVFPTTWTRLNEDPKLGAKGLVNELGPNGHIAIAFNESNQPIACGGVVSFTGKNSLQKESDQMDAKEPADSTTPSGDTVLKEWETCCWCVHPSARGQRLASRLLDEVIAFLRSKGCERFYCNYAPSETGHFWPKLGFEIIPGAGGMLSKGFKIDPEKEGLREDIQFAMGVMSL